MDISKEDLKKIINETITETLLRQSTECKLLTKKDLAERWRMSEQAIDDYRAKGIITAVKGLASIRFSPQHIAEIEGVKLERFSPLERKKLEREIEELKQKLATYEDVKEIILNASSKMINL